MRFYDRKEELDKLQEINSLSERMARMTVITGRRRIGKTSLVLKAYENDVLLYFFVSRKTEAELCRDFADEITQKLHLPILGTPTRFADIFTYLMQLAKTRHFILMIDEFQEFRRVNN
ncbi:MAG: AAA family ATPase, partial [Prevotella sp.]|nr:AAA family ATPase [Prevotella sp.]